MNALIKKILSASLIIVLDACAHYPNHYPSYPAYGGYSNGYVIKRNYYGVTPYYYPPPRFQYFSQPIPPRRTYVYPGFGHNQWQHGHDGHGHHDHDNSTGSGHHWGKDNPSHHGDGHNNHPYQPQGNGRHDFNHPNGPQYRPQGFERPHR
ncbi:MAG: hypothetical protein Q8N96_03125 [Methylovulum sp.]|nr:hypothetical protein [Methylovulum sp.]